jgi:heptosyltransferase-2
MSRRVIVRLPNWLGDTVMAVPAIRALRAHWPEARLLLAGPWAPLLVGQGLADLLVAYPRRWSGRLGTADAVRRFGGEIAFLMPNSLEAALAARYWGARRIVGFARGGRSWLLTDRLPLPAPRLHQIDEYRLLVEWLGTPVAEGEPRLTPPAADSPERCRARALLAEVGAPQATGRPLIGIHVGAAFGPAKTWPPERVIELCREISADGARAVLLGAPSDAPIAASVLQHAPGCSVVGRDAPELMPAVLTELDALVSGDTGAGHLAAALGTPVVALFGPTDPTRTAPRGRAEILQHAVACAPCSYRECPIDHACMRGIDAGHVRARLRTLLSAA